jgi:hypothetical protein
MEPRLVGASRKAITLPGWKWLPGMLGVRDCDPSYQDYLRPEIRICNKRDVEKAILFGSIPDLKDSATLGAILQLVREACRDPHAYLCFYDGYDSVEWGVCSSVIELIREELKIKPLGWMRFLVGDAPSEGEALILALEEAERIYALFKDHESDGSRK